MTEKLPSCERDENLTSQVLRESEGFEIKQFGDSSEDDIPIVSSVETMICEDPPPRKGLRIGRILLDISLAACILYSAYKYGQHFSIRKVEK
jgi:hypothetical protein